MLKFGPIKVTTKDIYGQRQITVLLAIHVNRVVVSDKGKDFHYIVGYLLDEAVIPVLIKTPKNIFSYGVSQYYKNFAYTISFNISEEEVWKTQYKRIWNEIVSQLFEKMLTEPIKRESRYVNGKLKTWKERIKTNFHGQDVLCNKHCNAAAVLKVEAVYKQGKNYSPQVYVEKSEILQCRKPTMQHVEK